VLNPLRQAEKFDPEGEYVRRHLPELSDLDPSVVHRPWQLDARELAKRDYPQPIVGLAEGRARFLAARSGS
jgi:deoxyribodipyrimidine photo-lyase